MTQTAAAQSPLPLPSTPRPVTRLITRRSWGEAPVRFWWGSALIVVLVAAFVTVGLVRQELKHRRLIETGEIVNATADKVAGVTKGQNPNFSVQRDQTIPVEFSAVMPDGKLVKFGGYLEPTDGRIRVGQILKLRVDPKDPTNWSEDVTERAWSHVLSVPLFMMLPVAVMLLAVAELRRRQVLAVWRHGIRTPGVVVGVRHSAAAPRSRIVQFTLADGRDRRILKALYPIHAGIPNKGHPLTLLVPQDRPQAAIVADLYVRPGDRAPAPPPASEPPRPRGFEIVGELHARADDEFQAANGTTNVAATVRCPREDCGAVNPGGVEFCRRCGAPLAAAQEH